MILANRQWPPRTPALDTTCRHSSRSRAEAVRAEGRETSARRPEGAEALSLTTRGERETRHRGHRDSRSTGTWLHRQVARLGVWCCGVWPTAPPSWATRGPVGKTLVLRRSRVRSARFALTARSRIPSATHPCRRDLRKPLIWPRLLPLGPELPDHRGGLVEVLRNRTRNAPPITATKCLKDGTVQVPHFCGVHATRIDRDIRPQEGFCSLPRAQENGISGELHYAGVKHRIRSGLGMRIALSNSVLQILDQVL